MISGKVVLDVYAGQCEYRKRLSFTGKTLYLFEKKTELIEMRVQDKSAPTRISIRVIVGV
jgi:hypothetical protein